MLERKINETFGDDHPTGFGTGWWSGVLSAFFGLLAFGAVVCLHFPQLLTSPELRPYYPVALMRLLIQALIVVALILGVASAVLRKKKILGLTGMLLALAATLLGGASVQINEPLHAGPAIGLDWFLLDMLLMTLIFSPFEVLWPAYPQQGIFRNEWLLDVVYFLSTHLPIQITSFLILLPATQLTTILGDPGLLAAVGRLPWLVQFLLAVLVADLAEYFIHRAFHSVPFLWRFHAIHHSSKALDWLAGSRSHLVDDVVVRAFILVPMMFAFSHDIIVAYLFFVTLHATWTHSNFRPSIKWLEPFLISPRFHHWHHTSQKEAIDRNFAIHFPWIDKLFGTHYYPRDKWPHSYGLDNEKIPAGFWGQAFYPFRIPSSEGVRHYRSGGRPGYSEPSDHRKGNDMKARLQRPTGAFIGASWLALFLGVVTYLAGVWNARMLLNEKGYYFTVLMLGLFAAVSLQKSVRDRMEGIAVTAIYFGLCWLFLGMSLVLLAVGLWNAELALSEKGFYGMAFVLSLFAAVAVQKNVRDVALFADEPPDTVVPS